MAEEQLPPGPHVLKSMKPKDKDFNEAEAIDQCINWIVNDFAKHQCRRPSGATNRLTRCTCMTFLANLPLDTNLARAVASYMVHWACLNRAIKMELLNEWQKIAEFMELEYPEPRTNRRFMLPTQGNEGAQHSICGNGLCGLLFVGRKLWKTSRMDKAERVHALAGKSNLESSRGKQMQEVYDSLDTFFTLLLEDGLPFATRIIRDETGLTTRDDDPDDVVLPPHITKHGCYARWCFLRGWKIEKKSAAKTIYRAVKEYTKRPYEDDDEDGISLWPQGSVYRDLVSWPCFLSYWKKNFKQIKVRKKGADTCTDCLILRNEFRMCNRRRGATASVDNTRDEEGGIDQDSSSSDDADDDENGDLEADIVTMEDTLAKAKAHVRAYQIQRDEAKRIINLARLDVSNHLPSLFQRKVLTIDMGQNLCLPNFEGEQPGDTYYMSPLTVLLFSVVNNATHDGKDRMNAYIWQEFEGDRGANNIASCLLMDLKKRGWLSSPNYCELTYIADNCGGQNKNKVVIRFLMWLVENKIFPQVKIFFLVKGHTKNAADRLFNLLKLTYHKRNIYTYDSLYNVLNENEYVDVLQMRPENFHNHLEWQNKFYRTPTGGEFKQTHVFTIYGKDRYKRTPSILVKQDDNESIIREDNLLPTTKSRKARKLLPDVRTQHLQRMELDLKQLVPTPLKPIKQVELWKKWAPLLPEEARNITCPKPSQEVIDSIKERNRLKTRKKSSEKKHLKTLDELADK